MPKYDRTQTLFMLKVRKLISDGVRNDRDFSAMFLLLHSENIGVSLSAIAESVRRSEETIEHWIDGENIEPEREWGWITNAILALIDQELKEGDLPPNKKLN